MTIQSSGTITLGDVVNELRVANSGRSATISLGDSDVLSSAGRSSGPISLGDLYGKSSFSATGTSASNSGIISNNAGTCSCSPYVTVIGGSGTISYSWTMVSSSGGPSLMNATSAQCTVSHSYIKNGSGSFNATLQCVVRNGNGAQITVTGITAQGDWSSYM